LAGVAQQSGDFKQMVFAIMKEMNKNTRFIAKNDIFMMVRNKMSEKDVDRVLIQLCEDGTIHSGYDNDVYSITE
jgi:translation elongation factor EF-Ts